MLKKILLAAVCLAPLLAYAVAGTYSDTGNGVKIVCASGTCDAPSAATEGLPLTSSFFSTAKGITVTVCADSGQTLSGAGTLTAYGYDPSVALWATAPSNNLSVSSASVRCQQFPGFVVAVPVGRVTWVPTGVTVSGGGTTIYISGW